MKRRPNNLIIMPLLALFLCGMASSINASDVRVGLSTREAWVGIPVVLQIEIGNAQDYTQPELPKIDGCDTRSAGAPSQSSQISIINGRRSESRSITLSYLITPRRAGVFEIPPITVEVDGRQRRTRPLQFVATKSETGDLLFVEIEGDTDRVFVGQPLDLTLKIWIKPFRDRQRNVTLSEADMWQMISRQTSWGSFADRLEELAENRQRPGGREVLRDDGQGNQRSYYLYEIDATVYPRRPGKIDGDDVQIVVNYPTELGRSRDPFESLFADSPFGRDPFGGNSPISQMMKDDFFASPFRNRLTVSSSRPIVGQATVDETEVLPVPATGRPADYRGAVGQYRIVTEATPTAVNAGDPITLNIGIVGTGPMELVQAPPLASLPQLTSDFKVADEPLAGFVEDKTKIFSTTIRPRREGITQIPAIPFSFFDPDTEEFQTVMSEPISIKVDKADSLSLDAIVGNARARDDEDADSEPVAANLQPDFTNDHSAAVLVSQEPATGFSWWWMWVIAPPLVWLGTWLMRSRSLLAGCCSRFVSANKQCLRQIDRATNESEIAAALIQYIGRRTGGPCESISGAAGALRSRGLATLANQVESFLHGLEAARFGGFPDESSVDPKHAGRELVSQIDEGISGSRKSRVRRANAAASGPMSKRRLRRSVRGLSVLIVAGMSLGMGNSLMAEESPATDKTADSWVLTEHQRQTILEEADAVYSDATQIAETDKSAGAEMFATAAQKYQTIIDSGVHNSRLFTNLGNAYLQSGQLGQAIVNYERARLLDPHHRQLQVNLDFARSLVASQPEDSSVMPASFAERINAANQWVTGLAGRLVIIWTLCIASVLFWGLMIVRTAGWQFPVWRWALVPALLMVVSFSSIAVTLSQATDDANPGILVASQVTLHAGDGDQFDQVHAIKSAQGQRVELLAQRGSWKQIVTTDGHTGWVRADAVEPVNL